MLKLKGCPRCQGDLQLAADTYGKYVNCLQCGFTKDLPDLSSQAVLPAAAGMGMGIEMDMAAESRPVFQEPERKAA